MEAAASLEQTVTNLFDAVRFSEHMREAEAAAKSAEGSLEMELAKLEAHAEDVSNLLASLKNEPEIILRDLSVQLEGFLATAKEQATRKLRQKVSEEVNEYRGVTASERDKALKSLEAYFSADPLPLVDSNIQVKLTEGIYEAKSRYECEGGMNYDFRLAAQNSRFFHQPFTLSQIGYELKIPVRFSRALLGRSRVPGFERLDQYVLADAETSGGRVRATFTKPDNGAKLKMIASGDHDDAFVGLEYNDQVQAVNVMNDPALGAYVDLEAVKKAAKEMVTELMDLSKKKVALLRLSINGDQALDSLDCRPILQKVLNVMGPSYKGLVKRIASGDPVGESGEGLSLEFIQARLKVLGRESAKIVSQNLGLQGPQ